MQAQCVLPPSGDASQADGPTDGGHESTTEQRVRDGARELVPSDLLQEKQNSEAGAKADSKPGDLNKEGIAPDGGGKG